MRKIVFVCCLLSAAVLGFDLGNDCVKNDDSVSLQIKRKSSFIKIVQKCNEGDFWISINSAGRIESWDAKAQLIESIGILRPRVDSVKAIAVKKDALTITAGSRDYTFGLISSRETIEKFARLNLLMKAQNSDGTLIAGLSDGILKEIKLYDHNGTVIDERLGSIRDLDQITHLYFSEDSGSLMVECDGQTFNYGIVRSRETLSKLQHRRLNWKVQNSDGSLIAGLGNDDVNLKLYSERGELIDARLALKIDSRAIESASFSKDSRFFFVNFKDGTQQRFCVVRNALVLAAIGPNVVLKADNANSSLFVALDVNGILALYDENGNCIDANVVSDLKNVTSLDISDENKAVRISFRDGAKRSYSLITNKNVLQKIKSNVNILATAQNRDGSLIAILLNDSTIKLLNGAGDRIDFLLSPSIKDVVSMTCSDDAQSLILDYSNRPSSTHAVIDLPAVLSYVPGYLFKAKYNNECIFALNSEGNIVLANEVGILDVCVAKVERPLEVRDVKFDGKYLIVTTDKDELYPVIALPLLERINSKLGSAKNVLSKRLSPTGRYLLVRSTSSILFLFDTVSLKGTVLARDEDCGVVTFSDDENFVVLTSYRGSEKYKINNDENSDFFVSLRLDESR